MKRRVYRRATPPPARPLDLPIAAVMAPLGVVTIAFAAFLPSLGNDWVQWDDGLNFLDNPHYRGLGPTQLRWMFTTVHSSHWIPLTWITLGFDYVLWGMNPFGYHLTNLVLHALGALTFYFVAMRLLRPGAGPVATDWRLRAAAAFTALFYAVHPLRVESVTWITERRDVLSGVLYVLTILTYLRAAAPDGDDTGRRRAYWTSVTLFALSLLAKTMTVPLPVLLLLLDVYPLTRLPAAWREWTGARVRLVLLEKVPFVALSAAGTVIAIVAQEGEFTTATKFGVIERAAVTLYSYTLYLRETVWPVGLTPLHEIPFHLNPFEPRFVASGAFMIAVTVAAVCLRRRAPWLAAGWAAYILALLPVSGVVHAGRVIAADRYTYLPALWMALPVGGLALHLLASPRLARRARVVVVASGAAIILAFSALTWEQTKIWQNTATLWFHALRIAPSAIGHTNYGEELRAQGRLHEARRHLESAVGINPNFAVAHNMLGNILGGLGERDLARHHFRESIRSNPRWASPHNNLGVMFAQDGRWAEALEHFEAALRVDPGFDAARINAENTRREIAKAR
jgi:hypothetical protein